MRDNIKERWRNFLLIVVDPWVLLFFILSLIIMKLSYEIPIEKPDNSLLKAILSVLLLLTSIGLGAMIRKRWSDLTESRAVEIRGSAAIRDLKLLLNAITSLRERVRSFLNDKEAEHTKDSKHYLGEIIDKCTGLQETAVVSIEHWTDILPEAEVKTEIGTITKLQGELAQKELDRIEAIEEIKAIREKTKEVKEAKEAIRTNLEERQKEIAILLEERHKQIAYLQAEVQEKQAKLDITVPTTGVGYSGVQKTHITKAFVFSRLTHSLEEVRYFLSSFKPENHVNLLQEYKPGSMINPYYYLKELLEPFLKNPDFFAFMSELHLGYLNRLLLPPGPTTVQETLELVNNLRGIDNKD